MSIQNNKININKMKSKEAFMFFFTLSVTKYLFEFGFPYSLIEKQFRSFEYANIDLVDQILQVKNKLLYGKQKSESSRYQVKQK